MNRVELVGRLTKDPELRYTEKDVGICSFVIAVNRNFKNENDEYETDFIFCKAFNKRAETISKYCQKGDLLGIEGSIRTGSYEKDGQRFYTTEIFTDNVSFLSPKSNNTKDEEKEENEPKNEVKSDLDDEVFAEFGDSIEISDDDIAF